MLSGFSLSFTLRDMPVSSHLHTPRVPSVLARGFSLIELLLTIGIIAVLAALVFDFSRGRLQGKVERLTCESNLRSLYQAFGTYVSDHGHWPQIPDHVIESSESNYWKWWMETLPEKEYGINEKHWLCPSDARERGANMKKEERDDFEGSYGPTHFDEGPRTPWEWPRQPWFMERSDFHGEGMLMMLPDGTIEASPWGI